MDGKEPPLNVPGGTPGFYDRPPVKQPPFAKDPRITDPRDDFISYDRKPIVPSIKPIPRIGGGIGGFSGKRTDRMMRR